MIQHNKKNRFGKLTINKSGFALLETLFYIAFLAVISIVVINAMIIMAKSFKETTIQTEITESSSIIEKISREIRQAKSATLISATDLQLSTPNEEFLLSGTDLQFKEGGVLTGNLNTPNITVNNITFTQITTVKGVAIKVFLTVSSLHDSLSRTYDFYDTITLRGGYGN